MPELVCSANDRDAWLAARRSGVTATDIVTIMGLRNPNDPKQDSLYSLYWQKMGHIPETPDNDRLRLGRELEPIVADRWTEASGLACYPGGLYRHGTRGWQLATLDRKIGPLLPGDPVELKTWADAARDMWQDGPPPAVRAQVLWQMDVMDAAKGHVGVLFLPSGEFRSYVEDHFDDWCRTHPGTQVGNCPTCDDQALMRKAGEEFMARLQMDLPPPDPDSSAATLAAARARFQKAKGKRGQVDGGLWTAWLTAKEIIASTEADARELETGIREQLGEADEIEVDGELVGRRIVSDQPVKAHKRHMDSLRRVKQQGDDSE